MLYFSEFEGLRTLFFQEVFQICPELIEDSSILMSLVSLQCEYFDVPLGDLFGYGQVLKVKIVAADAEEQLDEVLPGRLLVRPHLLLPVLELPEVPVHENRHHSLPLGVAETSHGVVHLEKHFLSPAATHLVLYHYPFLGSTNIYLICIQHLIRAILQEGFGICHRQVAS